jgi:subtilase family serine protease
LPIESVANDIGGHSATSCTGLYDGNCVEANLDVQYIMAVAQNTPTTYYYFNDSSWSAWLLEVSDMEEIPSIFSISYSGYEEFTSTSEMDEFNNQAMILGLQGVTLISASGDDGVAGL